MHYPENVLPPFRLRAFLRLTRIAALLLCAGLTPGWAATRRAVEPRREALERHREFVSVDHLDVEVELCHPQRKPVGVVGAQHDLAGELVNHLDVDRDADLRGDGGGGSMYEYPGTVGPGRLADASDNVLDDVVRRDQPRLKPHTRRCVHHHAVDPEDPPVIPVEIPRKQVPERSPAHQSLRFGMTDPLAAPGLGVAEPQPLVAADRGGDRAESRQIKRRSHPWNNARRLPYRLDAPTQARGQHLLQLRERGKRCLFDTEPLGRDRTQPDRDRDRLLVVKQQWGHRRPGDQPVAARDARTRVHGIAERPQPGDVGTHRPRAHLKPAGEFGARPVALELEQ